MTPCLKRVTLSTTGLYWALSEAMGLGRGVEPKTRIFRKAWAFCAGLKASLVETKSEPFSIILSIKSDRVKVKRSEHVIRPAGEQYCHSGEAANSSDGCACQLAFWNSGRHGAACCAELQARTGRECLVFLLFRFFKRPSLMSGRLCLQLSDNYHVACAIFVVEELICQR